MCWPFRSKNPKPEPNVKTVEGTVKSVVMRGDTYKHVYVEDTDGRLHVFQLHWTLSLSALTKMLDGKTVKVTYDPKRYTLSLGNFQIVKPDKLVEQHD